MTSYMPNMPIAPGETFHVGKACFFMHPEHSWLLGVVERELSECKYEVSCSEARYADVGRLTIASDHMAPMVNGSEEEVRDLLHLPYLHGSAMLYHVRQRYFDNHIYTNIGPILLALNPFTYDIPHYRPEMMQVCSPPLSGSLSLSLPLLCLCVYGCCVSGFFSGVVVSVCVSLSVYLCIRAYVCLLCRCVGALVYLCLQDAPRPNSLSPFRSITPPPFSLLLSLSSALSRLSQSLSLSLSLCVCVCVFVIYVCINLRTGAVYVGQTTQTLV